MVTALITALIWHFAAFEVEGVSESTTCLLFKKGCIFPDIELCSD